MELYQVAAMGGVVLTGLVCAVALLRKTGGLVSPRKYAHLLAEVNLPEDHWQRRQRRWAKAQAALDAKSGRDA